MKHDVRRAAVTDYKERKVVPGIYALRCTATGETWVGRAPDLSTIQNRLMFALKLGTTPHRTLQAAAKAHGAEAFTYEEVERLDDDLTPAMRDLQLKQRLNYWVEELGAVAI